MLIAKNLSKKYFVKTKTGIFSKSDLKEIHAVKDVSLTIKPGHIVGLLGINGAGKTTTIKMLCGTIEPTSGSIQIDDVDVVKNHLKAKTFINLITSGEKNLYWRLTARENLEYFASLYNIPKQKIANKVQELLDTVNLTDSADLPVERYSKGMKQRLQIARGLINDPKYIFLDEPTLGLDITIAKELRQYIKKIAINSKKGVLLTTHYIYEAEELCDYIYIILDGKIAAEGTFSELRHKMKVKMDTLVTVNCITDKLKKDLTTFLSINDSTVIFEENTNNLIKITSPKNHIGKIVDIISKNGTDILEVQLTEPSLEDILLTTINGGDKIEKLHINS